MALSTPQDPSMNFDLDTKSAGVPTQGADRRQFLALALAGTVAVAVGPMVNAAPDPSSVVVPVRPFTFRAPESELADLRRRIGASRWPSRELVSDASQGVQL